VNRDVSSAEVRGQGWGSQNRAEWNPAVSELQSQLELDLGGTKVLCVHGSPRSVVEDIHATTSDEELAQMFNGTRPAVLAAGHTHVQLARLHGSTLIVNPGSVGLPFNSWPPNGAVRMSPWAEYAVLTVEDGCISTELRRAPYDVAALLDHAIGRDRFPALGAPARRADAQAAIDSEAAPQRAGWPGEPAFHHRHVVSLDRAGFELCLERALRRP